MSDAIPKWAVKAASSVAIQLSKDPDATRFLCGVADVARLLVLTREAALRDARLAAFDQRSVMVGMPVEWNQACSACENAILALAAKEPAS